MHPYLFKGLALGPVVVRRLVGLIPADQYDIVVEADRFTIREVIAHLADWEVLFRGRMEFAYADPGIQIVTFDEGERAIELNYASWDIEEQLVEFSVERAKTIAFLESLKPEEFRTPYVHPANGPMIIEDQANMLLGHDMYHVEQLSTYLS